MELWHHQELLEVVRRFETAPSSLEVTLLDRKILPSLDLRPVLEEGHCRPCYKRLGCHQMVFVVLGTCCWARKICCMVIPNCLIISL